MDSSPFKSFMFQRYQLLFHPEETNRLTMPKDNNLKKIFVLWSNCNTNIISSVNYINSYIRNKNFIREMQNIHIPVHFNLPKYRQSKLIICFKCQFMDQSVILHFIAKKTWCKLSKNLDHHKKIFQFCRNMFLFC